MPQIASTACIVHTVPPHYMFVSMCICNACVHCLCSIYTVSIVSSLCFAYKFCVCVFMHECLSECVHTFVHVCVSAHVHTCVYISTHKHLLHCLYPSCTQTPTNAGTSTVKTPYQVPPTIPNTGWTGQVIPPRTLPHSVNWKVSSGHSVSGAAAVTGTSGANVS